MHGHNVWNSLYFRLFAVLVRPDLRQLRPWSWSSEHLTRILEILTSDYVSRTIADTVQTEEERQIGTITIQMTFSCIFDAVWRASSHDVDRSQTGILQVITSLSQPQPALGPLAMSRTPSQLEATVCLCLWDGTYDKILVNHDVPKPDKTFVRAIVQWIWSNNIPTDEDIIAIISMPGFLRSTEPRPWSMTVLEELICMMESRRQTWQQFNTRVLVALVQFPHFAKGLHSKSTHNDSPSFGEIIGHIGLHMTNYSKQDRSSLDLVRPLASSYAFSALIEMLSSLCQTRAIEDIPLTDIDVALVRILGPRQQCTTSNLDVEVYLAVSDGMNILTREKLSEASLKSLIAALIRWLWSDDLTSDIPQHIAQLNHNTRYLLDFNFDNVVIALIQLEHSRTHTLDQAFALLNTTATTSIHKSTLAVDLLDFIATCTRANLRPTPSRENHEPFSREQADILCRTYNWLRRIEYYWEDREERMMHVASFRDLWMDLYGTGLCPCYVLIRD